MRILVSILLSLGLLGGGVGLMLFLIATKPKVAEMTPPRMSPSVEYTAVVPEDWQIWVQTQGNVLARTETNLTAEVAGRIVAISPRFKDGGFFEAGDVLLEIDSLDYEAALAEAQARLAQARLALAQEEAQAEQAKQDWQSLGLGTPGSLVLRVPQMEQARANIAAAEAAVRRAERNLDRTQVRAPYAGRIRQKLVDVGQNVNGGSTVLASIYAVDVAEVRLPLSPSELNYISLPESSRHDDTPDSLPPVQIIQHLGAIEHSWQGYLDRTEGTIDERSRLTYVVARVPDPYGGLPPLKIGSFVEARISGRHMEGVYVVPRRALIDEDSLYVIREDNTLARRDVEVFWSDSERAVVTAGLTDGERVCLTPILYFIEGMSVRPLEPRPAPKVPEAVAEQATPTLQPEARS